MTTNLRPILTRSPRQSGEDGQLLITNAIKGCSETRFGVRLRSRRICIRTVLAILLTATKGSQNIASDRKKKDEVKISFIYIWASDETFAQPGYREDYRVISRHVQNVLSWNLRRITSSICRE